MSQQEQSILTWCRIRLAMAAKFPQLARHVLRLSIEELKRLLAYPAAFMPSKRLVASTVTRSALALATMMSQAPPVAQAAGIVVNDLGGGIVNDTKCTLAEAIIAANNDAASNGCAAGSGVDTITFSVTGQINLTVDLSFVSNDLTISGPGSSQLTVDGGGTHTTFYTGNSQLSLSGITISHSATSGVYTNSPAVSVNINDCVISNNNVSGVYSYNGSHVTISDSTIEGNGTLGVYVRNGAYAYLYHSTVSSNTQSGVYATNGSVVGVYNSTISGNQIAGVAVSYGSYSHLANVTVVGNATEGLYVDYSSTANMGNTIISGNNGGGADVIVDSGGTLTSLGHNLVKTGPFPGAVASDIVGVDPLLGAFALNNGNTKTYALNAGSPAVNKGDNAICASIQIGNVDQRNMPRVAPCDIGAFEYYSMAVGGVAKLFTMPPPTDYGWRGLSTVMGTTMLGLAGWLFRRKRE